MSEEKKETIITERQLEEKFESTAGLEKYSLEELRERQTNGFRQKKEDKAAEPLSETQLAYIKKINDSIKKESDFSLESLMSAALNNKRRRTIVPYPIKFEDCEKLFYAIMENELSVNNEEMIIEDVNRQKISEILRYFTGYTTLLNPNKGIYLYGAVGRGKTIIMKSIMVMCNTIETKLDAAQQNFTAQRFAMKNAKTIVSELAESKKPEVMKQYYGKVWCFDDFGAEDSLKLWGNDLNVLGDIVVERYQKYQQGGLLTHATSNVKSEDWKNKYGDRVESRLVEMFNVIRLEGVDKRKL